MKRQRQATAIVRYNYNDVDLTFRMTREGLKVKRKYSREGWATITLKQLAILSGLCPLYRPSTLPAFPGGDGDAGEQTELHTV